MATANRIGPLVREGVGLFLATFAFFYSHVSLLLLSLIPSSFRAVQMWNDLATPFWMEVVVELTRVVLFFFILARLEKTDIRQLFHKPFWAGFNIRFTAHMQRNWPHIFIAQIVAFIVLMYGLMNVLIDALVNEHTVRAAMSVLKIEDYDNELADNAVTFFLKNMSVIPMSMVYIARMCGFGAKAGRL
jgi:hypothetical protein